MSETPVEATDTASDAPAATPEATPAATPASDAAPVKTRKTRTKAVEPDPEPVVKERTKPRTVDSDEPSLGWTVQHGTPFTDQMSAPGQVLPPEIAADQPVVGGALYVEDASHPDGYQQLVQ